MPIKISALVYYATMAANMVRLFLALIVVFGGVMSASAQTYRPSFQPDEMTDRPVGAPNVVMVLGTPHLHELPDNFQIEMIDPLVDRLVEWRPTAIATESSSGLLCDTMRRQAWRYPGHEKWCDFDPTPYGDSIGLDVIAANEQAERLLADWPEDPLIQQRRRLAAIFLAAGEPDSALVQWLRLPTNERRADDVLTEAMASYLTTKETRRSEGTIAARVAARMGLERTYEVDDQAFYAGPEPDQEAYGAAIMAAWDNPATARRREAYAALFDNLGQPGAFFEMYRALNAPSQAELIYASDFGAVLQDPSDEGFGRRYLSYWEARNLRMVANIRELLGRKPGTRMLAIVGASHKPYYEAYLAQMRDVKLVDVMPLLQN
ncbi:MAG: DUF5694 domain-containing protein [Erythrobacter sp.]|jgi:hypothetical protein|nr:DUF5694 domain-containing protein [Erythrobacter sp.]